jgi:hypothetical protein
MIKKSISRAIVFWTSSLYNIHIVQLDYCDRSGVLVISIRTDAWAG